MSQLIDITNMGSMMTPTQNNNAQATVGFNFIRQSDDRMPKIARRMRRRNRSSRH